MLTLEQISLKQIFKKLLQAHTFNRLKQRINRLNALGSYKAVLKPSLPAKLQTTNYLDILIGCFFLCMEKHFNL